MRSESHEQHSDNAESGGLPRHIARNRRRHWLAAGLLVLALLAGAVIGAGGTIVYMGKKRYRKPPPDPEMIGSSVVQAMKETFELTSEEEERLRELMVKSMYKVDAIRKESWNAIGEEFDELSGEVDVILGPDRGSQWEKEKVRRYGERKVNRYKRRNRRDMDNESGGAGRK